MSLSSRIKARIDSLNSLLVLGLDSYYEKIPKHLKKGSIDKAIFNFNKQIIDATQKYVAGFKLNYVCYSSFGINGLIALERTNKYIHKNYPSCVVILDCKKDENIGEYRYMAKKEVFDWLGADIVTVLPWMGSDALEVFLEDEEKGILLICRNSNPSAAQLQDLKVKGKPLYQVCAELVMKKNWGKKGNLLIEAPANFPEALKKIRKAVGEKMMILTVGVGSQGGKLEDIKYGMNKNGDNLLLNKGKAIIFASSGRDFAKVAGFEAKKLRDEINVLRKKEGRHNNEGD